MKNKTYDVERSCFSSATYEPRPGAHGGLYIVRCHLNSPRTMIPNGSSTVIRSDPQEETNMVPPVVKPKKVEPEAGREFIEGIRKGLKDYADGRCKVFKNAGELLDELLGQ